MLRAVRVLVRVVVVVLVGTALAQVQQARPVQGSGPATMSPVAAPSPVPQRVSNDPYTGGGAQHRTEVESDVASWGSTIVSAFQVGRFTSTGAMNIGWSTSTDGGSTWTSGFLQGVTTAAGGPWPRTVDQNVAYDAKHGVWLIGTLGMGLVGSSYQEESLTVSRSTDGLTWGAPVTVTAVNYPDKSWVTCDNQPASPYRGNCYALFVANKLSNRFLGSTSTDGGLTWSTPVATATRAGGYDVQPIVAPDGTLVVVANQFFKPAGTVVAFRSTDGGAHFTDPVVIDDIATHKVSQMRAFVKPSVGMSGDGRIYVTWADCRFRSACAANDIVLATSADGVFWSPVSRVGPDAPAGPVDDFLPAIGVDPATSGSNTTVGIHFYSLPVAACGTSGKPSCQVNARFISSADGGASWSAPLTLNASPMTPTWFPNSRGRMVGDYTRVAYSNGNAVTVAALATRASYDTAMYATVLTPNDVPPPPPPSPPSNSVPPVVSGTAQQGQVLTASAGTWSGSPAPTFAYQWQSCAADGSSCGDISGATTTSYTPVLADVGATLRALVTASNSAGSATAASAVTPVVTAAPPPVTGPSTAVLDDFNRADTTGPPSASWAHQPVASASATADLHVVGNKVTGYAGSNADYWAADQFGADSEVYVTVATKPTTASDTVALGLRLANPDTANLNGYQAYFYNQSGTDTYQVGKRVNGAFSVLASATGPELAAGDVLWFRATGPALELWRGRAGAWTKVLGTQDSTYTGGGFVDLVARNSVVRLDDFGGGTTGGSPPPPPPPPPPPSAPVNSAAPAVSGTAQQGQVLTASAGTWTGNPAPTFAYQWQSCAADGSGCGDVPGATGTSYTPVLADVGATLRALVTASNSAGSATAASAVTPVVTAAPAPVTGPSTAVLDDFNRADTTGPPSASWAHQPVASSSATADLHVAGNKVTGYAGSNADYWAADQFGPDSEAFVTVATKPSASGDTVALGLRLASPDTTSMNGYQAYFYNQSSTDTYQIGKRVNGAFSVLASATGPELAAGDVLWFRATGPALELWRGRADTWTKVLGTQDSTYTAGGYLSLVARNSVVRLTDFGGGTVG